MLFDLFQCVLDGKHGVGRLPVPLRRAGKWVVSLRLVFWSSVGSRDSVSMCVRMLVAVAMSMSMVVSMSSNITLRGDAGLFFELLDTAGMQVSRVGSCCLLTRMWQELDNSLQVLLGPFRRPWKRDDDGPVPYSGYRSCHSSNCFPIRLQLGTETTSSTYKVLLRVMLRACHD